MRRGHSAVVLTVVLVFYVLFLFIISVIPVPQSVTSIYGFDKVVHFLEYFLFAIILVKFLQMYNVKNGRLIVISLSVGITFMLLSEIIQGFVPGRTFSFFDLLADLLGFIVGLKVFK